MRQLNVAISAGAERNLHLIHKNHAECKSIEAAFRDIREEMVNNRVDSQTLLDRIDGGIVAPLKTINDTTYTEVDQRIGLYRYVKSRPKTLAMPSTTAWPASTDCR